MIDTCQANTMYSQFYSPNILATGSSEIEENSYSVRCSYNTFLPRVSSQAARKRQRYWRVRHRQLYALYTRIHGRHQQNESGLRPGLGTHSHLDAALSDALTP